MLEQGPVANYLYIVKGTLCASFSQDRVTTVNLQRRTVPDACLLRIEFCVSSSTPTPRSVMACGLALVGRGPICASLSQLISQ